MSPETKELTVPPTSGLAHNITPDDLRLPPAVTQSATSMQPMIQFESQLLAILSDIDATSSPFASPAAAAQQSVDTSPLTERALRYHRQDAFRTDRNNVAPVPLPSSTDLSDPLDTFGAETHDQARLTFTPTTSSESLNSTIQSKIPSLGPEQYRSTSLHSLPRMHFEYSTPATFPRLIQAPHPADQRPLSTGPRCPLPARSRASYSMMSSSTSTPPAKAAAKELRPFAPETSSRLDDKPGRPQGAPSPVTSSALRAISGSGSERTHGLRPTDPVSPRALLGGPPTHLDCLKEIWDSMNPSLRTRIGSITLQEAEASVARAQATTEPGRRVRQQSLAPSPSPRRNTSTSWNCYRRKWPPSMLSTRTSRVAFATS